MNLQYLALRYRAAHAEWEFYYWDGNYLWSVANGGWGRRFQYNALSWRALCELREYDKHTTKCAIKRQLRASYPGAALELPR